MLCVFIGVCMAWAYLKPCCNRFLAAIFVRATPLLYPTSSFKPKPSHPFQEVAGDFSYAGQDYLILIDCYSDWPDIIPMGHNNTTSSHVVAALKQSFCCTGVPDIFWSYQGPQFTAKSFQDFAKIWWFQHITSSPMWVMGKSKPP